MGFKTAAGRPLAGHRKLGHGGPRWYVRESMATLAIRHDQMQSNKTFFSIVFHPDISIPFFCSRPINPLPVLFSDLIFFMVFDSILMFFFVFHSEWWIRKPSNFQQVLPASRKSLEKGTKSVWKDNEVSVLVFTMNRQMLSG
jgi:hypothetical protein